MPFAMQKNRVLPFNSASLYITYGGWEITAVPKSVIAITPRRRYDGVLREVFRQGRCLLLQLAMSRY